MHLQLVKSEFTFRSYIIDFLDIKTNALMHD